MNTDIRLLVSFKGHRKRKRLKVLLGTGATDYLIDLWLTVAQDCPEGILTGWDEVDIALAAGWDGDQDEFVKALIDCGWLEKGVDGVYEIHDWQEHQGWASHARMRSEAARKAAEMRWANKRQCDGNATAMRPHQKRNAPSPSPNPSPIPSPNPSIRAHFDTFWKAYPNKKSKNEAIKAFAKIDPDEELLVRMLATLEKAKTSEQWRERERFIPYPATWLNAKRWEDEYGEDQQPTTSGRLAASIGAPSKQT